MLALVALVVAGCDAPANSGMVAVGSPAPAYKAASLAGDTVALADLQGSIVLMNIWATWCPPCREEMPDLEAIHQSYSEDDLRVVGVSVDEKYASGAIENFLQENAIDFTILHDPDGRVTRTFRTRGVPETFLIGRDGDIVARWIGQVDPAEVRRTIDAEI